MCPCYTTCVYVNIWSLQPRSGLEPLWFSWVCSLQASVRHRSIIETNILTLHSLNWFHCSCHMRTFVLSYTLGRLVIQTDKITSSNQIPARISVNLTTRNRLLFSNIVGVNPPGLAALSHSRLPSLLNFIKTWRIHINLPFRLLGGSGQLKFGWRPVGLFSKVFCSSV